MPAFTSFEAYGREVKKMANEMEREARRRITREQAEAAKVIAIREARRDVGSDVAFSGWNKRDEARGLDNLQIKPSRKNDGHWLFPTRKSGGPWKVATAGRNMTTSKFGGAAGRGGVGMFQGPGVNRQSGITGYSATAYKKTGGIIVRTSRAKRWSGYTKGKGTADRAADRMERELPKIAEVGVRRVLVKHFDVT